MSLTDSARRAGTPAARHRRVSRRMTPWITLQAPPARVVHLLAVLALVAVWRISLATTELAGMDDLGLVSVLSPAFFLAVVGLAASFAAALRPKAPDRLVLAAHIIALFLVISSTAPVLEGLPRLEASFRHIGITEHLQRGASIDPTIDAYFNWPGFFALFALVTGAGAADDLIALATWAPLGFAVLMLPALLLIGRALTTDVRVRWLGVALFYAANWSGQDYFSPQAFALLLYVYVAALLLSAFRGPVRIPILHRITDRPGWQEDGEHRPATGAQGVVLMATVVLILLTTVYSHQLTPYAAVFALSALVLVGRCRARLLPVLLAVATSGWLLFFALTFLVGHVDLVVGGVGDVSGSAAANVTGRLTGSVQHQIVVAARLLLAAAVWLLALLGAWTLVRSRRSPAAATVLGFAPFLLLGLQSYGGEAAVRVYLLGLPWVAFLAAVALAGVRDRALPAGRTALVGVVVAALALGTVFTRHGNERAESFTAGDVAAAQRMYDIAPRGSVLMAASQNTAWRFEEYNEYDYRTLVHAEPGVTADPPTVEELLEAADRAAGRRAFLLVTSSQLAAADLYGTVPATSLTQVVQEAERQGLLVPVYSNGDAVLFELREEAE